MLPSKLAFVDIETTGGSLRSDQIIEIGILRVENGQLVESFNSLVNPHTVVPDNILVLTGINRTELEKAPSFSEIQNQVYELLDDCVFVAHNARFDYGFIQTEFKRREKTFQSKQCCTVRLSRLLFPHERHHNLDKVIERHHIECNSRHRAFDDAKVLFDFYNQLQTLFPTDILEQYVSQAMYRPSLPLKLTEKDLENLPEKPGVYLFYGQGEIPLYIGKSVNIRQRVLSHFSQNHLQSIEMKISQQIERIETIETAGELGALLKESELIKKLQPLYNRKLRQSQEMIVAKKVVDGDYHKIVLENLKKLTTDEIDSVMGIFRSKKQAKQFLKSLVDEYKLCPKLLGLENTSTSCFDYRLEKCKGACIGRESPLHYNFRFLEAFTKYKIRTWPYDHHIVIKEEDPHLEQQQFFLVDKWCILGSNNTGEFDSVEQPLYFDLDAYKILHGFLAKHPKPGLLLYSY